jgi:hypothetical protein
MPAIMPAKRRDPPKRARHPRTNGHLRATSRRQRSSLRAHFHSFAHRRAFVASSIAKACLCSSILCLGLRAASLGAAYWNTAVERTYSGSTTCPRG